MYKFIGLEEMGRRLTKLRGGLSRTIVAEAIGVTSSALSNYENGIRVPRDEVKARLANFYKTTVEKIFFIQ